MMANKEEKSALDKVVRDLIENRPPGAKMELPKGLILAHKVFAVANEKLHQLILYRPKVAPSPTELATVLASVQRVTEVTHVGYTTKPLDSHDGHYRSFSLIWWDKAAAVDIATRLMQPSLTGVQS